MSPAGAAVMFELETALLLYDRGFSVPDDIAFINEVKLFLHGEFDEVLTAANQDGTSCPAWLEGAAALSLFVRVNWTGPWRGAAELQETVVENRADDRAKLERDGEDVAQAAERLDLLLRAETCLLNRSPAEDLELQLLEWWRSRCLMVHQAILSGPSPSLKSNIRKSFLVLVGTSAFSWPLRPDLESLESEEHHETGVNLNHATRAVLLTEVAQVQLYYLDTANAKIHLDSAMTSLAVDVTLDGYCGVRTKWQVEALPQLMLSVVQTEETICQTVNPTEVPQDIAVNDIDILGHVKLDKELSKDAVGVSGNLPVAVQLLVMALADQVTISNAKHQITDEQVAPYAARIMACGNSIPMVKAHALLVRTRLEHEKGKYAERSILQLEELEKFYEGRGLSDSASRSFERLTGIFASSYPPRWGLKKEMAIVFGKAGMVKSALKLFESIGMWEEVVDCYRLMGDIRIAERVIRSHIAETGETPRLLCVLGDVTLDAKYYEEAWFLSNQGFARAKRSLGRLAVENHDYRTAIEHYKVALAINPLYTDSWFTMCHAALCVDEWDTAALAATRVVQQTPENGEAWNNLAQALLGQKNRKGALNALREAAKHKRDSWRIWDNLLVLAIEEIALLQVVQAMDMLVSLRGREGIRPKALALCVAEVLQKATSSEEAERQLCAAVCRKLLPFLGRVSALDSSNAVIWRAFADLNNLAGNIDKEIQCRQKEVRAIGSTVLSWASVSDSFAAMANPSLLLGEAALRSGDGKTIHSALLHIRSVLGRSRETLSAHTMYTDLERMAHTLEKAEQE